MTEKKSLRSLVAENPSALVLLGLCPVLGTTADVRAALAMGCILTLAMVCSALIMNGLKKVLPRNFLFPAIFLVCAGVVSVIDLLTHALFPSVYQLLGIYVSVLSVSLLLFVSAADGCHRSLEKTFGQCLALALLLFVLMLVIAAVREVFGNASFAGVDIPALKDCKIAVLMQPAGAFLITAFVAAGLNAAKEKAAGSEAFSGWICDLFENNEKTEEVVS